MADHRTILLRYSPDRFDVLKSLKDDRTWEDFIYDSVINSEHSKTVKFEAEMEI
jgi:hypothetical protein